MADSFPPSSDLPLPGADDPIRRVRFRLWQVAVTLITLSLSVWFFTLGVFPGIAFAFIAKHILIGVVAAGLHYPRGFDDSRSEPSQPDA